MPRADQLLFVLAVIAALGTLWAMSVPVPAVLLLLFGHFLGFFAWCGFVWYAESGNRVRGHRAFRMLVVPGIVVASILLSIAGVPDRVRFELSRSALDRLDACVVRGESPKACGVPGRFGAIRVSEAQTSEDARFYSLDHQHRVCGDYGYAYLARDEPESSEPSEGDGFSKIRDYGDGWVLWSYC